ncbi:MAG: hypothetical protein II233_00880 [Clostridia bacterium]|nr:hypothetical protein [Clostridia bacterium]
MLDKYIADYIKGFTFTPSEHITLEISDIKADIATMEYFDGLNHREKAHVTLQKGNLKYEYDSVDMHNWDNNFFNITINERSFLCFRKTLYGFTLLDTATLLEEYEYFPSKVLNGEESFIITDVKTFGNLIIFDGCYWACPTMFFAYDYSQKRFINLSKELGVYPEKEITIKNDTLFLIGLNDDEEEVEATITQNEIYSLLEKKGALDF